MDRDLCRTGVDLMNKEERQEREDEELLKLIRESKNINWIEFWWNWV